MSQAFKCDKCGVMTEKLGTLTVCRTGIRDVAIRFCSHSPMDFCVPCSNALEQFLKNKK